MKKGTFLLSLLIVVLLLSSWRPIPPKAPFTIKGHITGMKNDSVFVYARVEDEKGNILRTDTFSTVGVDDKFTVKGTVGNTSYAYVYIGKGHSKNFSFILEKGTIIMKGRIDSLGEVDVSGTPDNDVADHVTNLEKERYRRIASLFTDYAKKDQAAKQVSEQAADRIRDSIMEDRAGFIMAHPDAMHSGIYIYVMQDRISLEKLEQLYNRLGSRIKNNSFGKTAGEKILARRRTIIGNPAPAFTMNDENGNPVSITDLKGKYVLLEFWASWCVPCRQEIPVIKEAYEKFRKNGLVIVSVSVDTDKGKWLKALKEESLPWANVRDILGTETSVAKLYGVQPIPDNFLISPDGKIVARALRGKALDAKLASVYNN